MSFRSTLPWLARAIVMFAGACTDEAPDDGDERDASTQDSGERDGGIASDDCLTDVEPTDSWFVEVQRFTAGPHALEIERARQPGDGMAAGETFAYELAGVMIHSDEDDACVRDPARLTYEYAHHNWDESWTVRTAKAVYVVRETFSFEDPNTPWTDTLEVRSLDGATVLWGPVPLQAAGCRSVPYDLNPCLRRTRLDQPPPGWGD